MAVVAGEDELAADAEVEAGHHHDAARDHAPHQQPEKGSRQVEKILKPVQDSCARAKFKGFSSFQLHIKSRKKGFGQVEKNSKLLMILEQEPKLKVS